jgi:hypothetical protein
MSGSKFVEMYIQLYGAICFSVQLYGMYRWLVLVLRELEMFLLEIKS